jgi:chemotaxis protein histidine kinase CheA
MIDHSGMAYDMAEYSMEGVQFTDSMLSVSMSRSEQLQQYRLNQNSIRNGNGNNGRSHYDDNFNINKSAPSVQSLVKGGLKLEEQNSLEALNEINTHLIALATLDVEKKRLSQLALDNDVSLLMQLEKEKYNQERKELLLAKKRERREMRRKEKEWMEFKEKADNERYGRFASMKAEEEKRNAERLKEEKRKQEADMERIRQQKAHAAALSNAKAEEERLVKERQRELDELLLMRKEESRSILVEEAIAEKER